MTIQKFRKKPVMIEASLLAVTNHHDIANWIATAGYNVRHASKPPMRALTGLVIETLEANMVANYGDWIIKGVNGEFYPCKPDIFEKTYEPAAAEPQTLEGHVAYASIIEMIENCTLTSRYAEYAGLADYAAFEAGQDNALECILKMLRSALVSAPPAEIDLRQENEMQKGGE